MNVDQRLRATAQQLRSAGPEQPVLDRTWQELLAARSEQRKRRARRFVGVSLALVAVATAFIVIATNLLQTRTPAPGEVPPAVSVSPSPTPTNNDPNRVVHHFPRTQLTQADWRSMRADISQLDPHLSYPSINPISPRSLRRSRDRACHLADYDNFARYYGYAAPTKGIVPAHFILAETIVFVRYGCPAGVPTLVRWLNRQHPDPFHTRALAYLRK